MYANSWQVFCARAFPLLSVCGRFFGGGGFGGFGGFGMGDEEEEEELKGHTINVDLYVTLKDLYVGKEIKASCATTLL